MRAGISGLSWPFERESNVAAVSATANKHQNLSTQKGRIAWDCSLLKDGRNTREVQTCRADRQHM
jgi:hypothetical protein